MNLVKLLLGILLILPKYSYGIGIWWWVMFNDEEKEKEYPLIREGKIIEADVNRIVSPEKIRVIIPIPEEGKVIETTIKAKGYYILYPEDIEIKCKTNYQDALKIYQESKKKVKEIARVYRIYISPSKDIWGSEPFIVGNVYIKKNGNLINIAKIIVGEGYACGVGEFKKDMEKAKEKKKGLWRKYYNLMKCICK